MTYNLINHKKLFRERVTYLEQDKLLNLLNKVRTGEKTPSNALDDIQRSGFEDLGYAKVDHHRPFRNGFPEVIYCQGKTPKQVSEIFSKLIARNSRVLATRADEATYEAIKHSITEVDSNTITYNHLSKTIVYKNQEHNQEFITSDAQSYKDKYSGKVAVVAAGTSDLPIAEEAYETAKIMGAEVEKLYDVGVAGIHRLLYHQDKLNKVSSIVVVAGMEGALPSVVGGLVDVPVIACPTSVGYGAHLGGISPLLTMLNSCASGISVVNIDNGFGAGYQAAVISRMVRAAAKMN